MAFELNEYHIGMIDNVVSNLEDLNIDYAILRRFNEYPDRIPGTQEKELDLDIMISHSDFNDAVERMKELGFRPKKAGSMSGLPGLAIRATENPKKALQLCFKTPAKVRSVVSNATQETMSRQPKTPYQKACENNYAYQLQKGELVLDFKNHLSHESPMNQMRIRLDPEVERGMLQRRKNSGDFYTLSPPDELAHIVTHCVFEYDGEFPEYYKNRCKTLKEKMSPSDDQVFEEVLSRIYYAASDVVYEGVWNNEYDEVRSKLESYSEY